MAAHSAPLWITLAAFTVLIVYNLLVELLAPRYVGADRAADTLALTVQLPTFNLPLFAALLIYLALAMALAALNAGCLVVERPYTICFLLAYVLALLILAAVGWGLYRSVRRLLAAPAPAPVSPEAI
jgi:hypothetical protein